MKNGFAIDLLRKVAETPLKVDHVLPGQEFPWGWIKNDPISPDLVGRWIKAGLIEDYKVGEMILTNSGERLIAK